MNSPTDTDSDDREPEDEASSPEERERWRLFERAVPEVFRRVLERALESGVEKISEGPENLRGLVADLKLPKEVLHYVYGQIDDTKKGIYRVVAKEIRDVLEHTKFSDEIADVLTKLSFEVNTQIRFVPNVQKGDKRSEEASDDDDDEPGADHEQAHQGRPRPRVVSKVVMKARDRLDRRSKNDDDRERPNKT